MNNKLITILLTLALCSCGSRKVETSKETAKENVTKSETTEIKTDTNETVKVVDTSTTDEIELIPIDNTKPIIYNGKEVHNAKIRHSKKKNGISVKSEKKVAQIERKDVKANIKREVKIKDKYTERESVSYWWLWILIIGAVYLFYRKYLR